MELSENISSAYFSQWVQTSAESKFYRDDSRTSKGSRRNSRKTSRQDSRTSFTKLYSPKAKYSEDEFKEALQRWIEYPEQEETMKLKKLVRQGVQPKLRSELWNDSSGGADIVFNSPHYYEEMIDDMGIQVPSSIPSTIFSGNRNVPMYLLSPDGETTCFKILYILSHMHPDIQYAPLIPPLTSIFLHFMDENLCYTCLSALVNSRRSMLDQSQRAYAVMAKTFQDSLKSYFMLSYKQIKEFIQMAKGEQIPKNTTLVPDWLIWMFHYIDFWTLVYIIDSFLVQGPKVLVRVGLIVFSQFAKFIEQEVSVSENVNLEDLFKQFAAAMPLRGYKLLQTAFRIRGLSRKRLERLKSKNVTLLENGLLDVPEQTWESLQPLTVFAVKGSNILSLQEWELLSSWLPDRLRIKKPVCLFTTDADGYSIRTLYNKCEGDDETILLVKSSVGEIFGALVTSSWGERNSGRRTLTYFGTGESFVFRLSPRPVKYSWTGLHKEGLGTKDLFMAGDDKSLMVGGGGENAIWLDNELYRGRSGASETFGNEQLTESPDFLCTRVEVLGFVTES
ncbi:hypothetical protein OS493_015079 [Desmophyllum pertusum]|uniref:TLDc domain-containing protein n=1 Tax=Desmophyllum pertusum TaxID=174260 RepID=A0A9W9ZRC0_9CNID|nr:hypothetical protein OS493_015079 [Desmophyllum pertusum]